MWPRRVAFTFTGRNFFSGTQNMPRRAPTGGRFAQPFVDPALPLCDLNSLWTHAYEKLMAENRRLIAANSSEPGTYLDYSNFLM